jgi:small subunit ribosomal protein S3
MLMKKFFIDYSVRKMKIEEFIGKYLPEESYSKIDLERTPLGVKIIIHTDRPGRIIGAGGR